MGVAVDAESTKLRSCVDAYDASFGGLVEAAERGTR
jgi:hypothetical protein